MAGVQPASLAGSSTPVCQYKGGQHKITSLGPTMEDTLHYILNNENVKRTLARHCCPQIFPEKRRKAAFLCFRGGTPWRHKRPWPKVSFPSIPHSISALLTSSAHVFAILVCVIIYSPMCTHTVHGHCSYLIQYVYMTLSWCICTLLYDLLSDFKPRPTALSAA